MTAIPAGTPKGRDLDVGELRELVARIAADPEGWLALVRGDTTAYSIAAASIVGKVCRDRLMAKLAVRYPGYGWEQNAGYPTRDPREAIHRLGITPHHRRSFGTVRMLSQLVLDFGEVVLA